MDFLTEKRRLDSTQPDVNNAVYQITAVRRVVALYNEGCFLVPERTLRRDLKGPTNPVLAESLIPDTS